MAGISIRWYDADDDTRWEKAEAKGRLGPKQAQLLAFWRKAKARYPSLESIEVSGGRAYVGKTGV